MQMSSVFISQSSSICKFNSESWVILNPIEQRIKAKIEAVGTPLKDWDIQINYGIKTGFNEAFIISGEKRKELIEQDPKSEEIIRPILRGRDIKKYDYDFANLWLINTHNGVKEKNIKPVNINDYPAIKRWLDFGGIAYNGKVFEGYKQIEKRADQGSTPYNLRNCAYMEDFSKQKIMWKIIGCNLNFLYDTQGFFCNNAVNIMTGEENMLLQFLGLMNSSLFDWYLKLTTNAEVQGGGIQLYSTTLETLPIKLDFDTDFIDAIKKRISNEIQDGYINKLIYNLYSLSKDEIKFIENQ